MASHNNGDASSYTTASITPTGNDLVLATFLNTKGSNPADTPTVSGNSITWVQVGTVTWDDGGSNFYRLTVFRGLVASPTAGTVVFDFGGVTQTGGNWSISQCSGVDTSGTNGSGAVNNFTTNTATSVNTLTVTLPAFIKANDGTWGAFGQTATNAATPGSGFTELTDVQGASPANGLETEWKNSNDTSVDASAIGTSNWAGAALEIVVP